LIFSTCPYISQHLISIQRSSYQLYTYTLKKKKTIITFRLLFFLLSLFLPLFRQHLLFGKVLHIHSFIHSILSIKVCTHLFLEYEHVFISEKNVSIFNQVFI
jgi:hypothetical protein